MASFYIREYAAVPMVIGHGIACGLEPGIDQAVITIGVGSVQSAAFNAETRFIRVHTDAICSVLLGTNPTATAANARMAANQTEFIGVIPGQKIAVITNT